MEQQELSALEESVVEERHDHAAWLWLAVGIGAVAGAAAMVWLMQYRKPDRSTERLLRRCADRLDTIEQSVSDLMSDRPGDD